MNRNINSIFVLLICVVAMTFSCESDSDPGPIPPNNTGNNSNVNSGGGNSNSGGTDDAGSSTTSDIKGCQYPTTNLTGNLTLEQGSFKVLGNAPMAYSIFGFVFKSAYDGTIKELGIKVPEKGKYTVRVYPADLFSFDILAETEIDADNDDWNFNVIDPLAIKAETSYIVCLYIPSKPDEQETLFYHISDFGYPQENGDITIESYASNIDNDKAKPEPKDKNSFIIFNGLVDFCFEAI